MVVALLAVNQVAAGTACDVVAGLGSPDNVIARATIDREGLTAVSPIDKVIASGGKSPRASRDRKRRGAEEDSVLARVAENYERPLRSAAAINDDIVGATAALDHGNAF